MATLSDQWKIEGKQSVEAQGSYFKKVDLAKLTQVECERACTIEMHCQSAVFVKQLCYLYMAREVLVKNGMNDSSVLYTKVPRLGEYANSLYHHRNGRNILKFI